MRSTRSAGSARRDDRMARGAGPPGPPAPRSAAPRAARSSRAQQVVHERPYARGDGVTRAAVVVADRWHLVPSFHGEAGRREAGEVAAERDDVRGALEVRPLDRARPLPADVDAVGEQPLDHAAGDLGIGLGARARDGGGEAALRAEPAEVLARDDALGGA